MTTETTWRMPGEFAPHERTVLGWPCREAMWQAQLEQARDESAATANAVAAFEPVTMVCATREQAADARRRLAGQVEIVVLPMDGSWLRDNGPIYVTDGERREARHFRFNGYGEYQAKRDRDVALGATLARHLGDDVRPVDLVLEGGALATDGAGTVVVTETNLLNPNRNWYLTREQVEQRLLGGLGADRVLWLRGGLVQDMGPGHTDGHTDLFLAFVAEDRCVMLAPTGPDDPNEGVLTENRARLVAAGYTVVDVPLLPVFEHEGEEAIAPHLNFYLCNGAVVVPVAEVDHDQDAEALKIIGSAVPDREVVPVPMRAHPTQGGAVHCITQQVPPAGGAAAG